jgi:uncharacterized membrane protein
VSLRLLIYLGMISVVPGIELRGAIPVGIGLGAHWLLVFLVSVGANCLIILPEFYALDLFYDRLLSRWGWFRHWMVERVRVKGEGLIKRYGLLGLALFVAIPLPGTGAYSGALLAWLLGMERRTSAVAIAAGVAVAGVAVTMAATGVFAALRRLL